VQLSFRDPDGFVFRHRGRILRYVYPHAVDQVRRFISSPAASAWMAERSLPFTEIKESGSLRQTQETFFALPAGGIVLEHRPVRFPNYPYEWPPEMLYQAAALTLRLAREAMASHTELKDASPYNIMFEGPNPVFLDVLSFGRLDPCENVWRPYAQFVRTFIYPLLAAKHFGLRIDEFLLPHRDGITPERMTRLCPFWRLCLPPFLGSVAIPALLSRTESIATASAYRLRRAGEAQESRFLLERVFRRADRLLRSAKSSTRAFTQPYAGFARSYSPPESAAKEAFVSATLERVRPTSLLDIGSAAGQFSLMAAGKGTRVVAIDSDLAAAGALWREAYRHNLDILPLIVDIARPPGAVGWANQEFPSFLDRARAAFDCILLLAVVHHLLVTERIPLDRIFSLAAELTTRWAIIEYVDPADPQFRRLARGRDALHNTLTPVCFEAAARQSFRIVDSRDVTPSRRIYLLSKA
jgi:SAM-dependent methyltransferase